MALGSFAAARGFRLVEFDEVGSTNDEAMTRAARGEDRVWVTAQLQTGGRGRRGRSWASPRGNLYASLLVVDPAPMASAAQIGFVAALALHDATSALLGPAAIDALKLKWPNDLLLGGAKMSGILVEATTLTSQRAAVIIGIGVNLVAHATGAPYPTTHLAAHLGDDERLRDNLFAELSDAMACRLDQWARGAGFAATRRDWMARAAGIGGPIRVESMGEPIVGRLRTMDEQGRLVIACVDGRERAIEAGDVFLSA